MTPWRKGKGRKVIHSVIPVWLKQSLQRGSPCAEASGNLKNRKKSGRVERWHARNQKYRSCKRDQLIGEFLGCLGKSSSETDVGKGERTLEDVGEGEPKNVSKAPKADCMKAERSRKNKGRAVG